MGNCQSLSGVRIVVRAYLSGSKKYTFYPPWRDHPLGGPVWGPNLISFCFISGPRRSFFHLNLQAVSAHF